MSYIDEHDEPSGDLCYLCTDPTKVSRTQYENTFLRTCLDNKLSASDRQNALKNYYANEQTRLSFFAQSNPRIKTIKEKFNVQLKNISRSYNEKIAREIEDLIVEYNDVFALESDPLPAISEVEHKIKLTTEKPVSTPVYRHPLFMQPHIEKHIEKLLKNGLIRESHSPYQANVWLVPKKEDQSKEQKYRLVMDFRRINSFTPQDSYPLPNIEEILSLLGQSKYMAAFDMSNGFHAIKVASEDIHKTAFSTLKGHWEWVRMPQGLKNSPATYQRAMNYKLRGLIGKICFVYVDDLIVFGKTFEEYVKNLRTVLNRLRETGLRLNPDKCLILQQELEYLGHKVSTEGIRPLERNVEKILNFPIPKNKKELERFIGLASYYRKFIPNFAKRANNLNKLKHKDIEFNFDEKCLAQFKDIVQNLSSYPLIAHPNNAKPFILHTDASSEGLGACLSQLNDKLEEKPVAYISRTLNKAELNYSTTEKEMLEAVWAMHKFRFFLFGQNFNLYTDHQALRGIFKNQSDNVTSRIVNMLSKTTDYHPNVIYKKGKENIVADALSRAHFATPSNEANIIPLDITNDLTNEELDIVNDIINQDLEAPTRGNNSSIHLNKSTYIWINEEKSRKLIRDYKLNKNINKRIMISPRCTAEEISGIKNLSTQTIKFAFPSEFSRTPQDRPIQNINTVPGDNKRPDHVIEAIRLQHLNDFEYVINHAKDWKENEIVGIQAENIESYNKTLVLLKYFILCSRLNNQIRNYLPKYVENEATRLTLIIRAHERGHWASTKVYNSLRPHYSWEGMKSQIEDYIKTCNICSKTNRFYQACVPEVVIDPPREPFEVINMDIYHYNDQKHLIIIDELTRYVWIYENVNMSLVYKRIKDFFLRFDSPKKLITDNGRELKNEKMEEICREFQVRRIPIAVQHSESKGICKRGIGTIKSQLDKGTPILQALYNYNHAIHSVTKRTPIE